jgi:hypothetical protein
MSTHTHTVHGLERRPAVHIPGSVSVRLPALGGAISFALILAFANLTSGSPRASESSQKIYTMTFAKHRPSRVSSLA